MTNVLLVSVFQYILLIKPNVIFSFLYNGITIIDVLIVVGSFMFLNFEL